MLRVRRAVVTAPNPGPVGGMSTASSLTILAASVECTFCSQQHESTSCTPVTDINKSLVLLMRTGRCFNCLRYNHRPHMYHWKDQSGSTDLRSAKVQAATDLCRRPQVHRTQPDQPMVTRNPAVSPNQKLQNHYRQLCAVGLVHFCRLPRL